jgi:hypothetical protein
MLKKNRSFKSYLLTALSLELILGSCARYQASTLSFLPIETSISSNENPNVLISWKALNREESYRYLGRDLSKKGYIPIQITLRNQTSDPMYLGAQNFSLPLSSPEEVAPQVHTSTGGRIAAWGVGGVFFMPLWIPAIVDGFGSAHANEALDRDYATKSLKKEELILPHSTFNGIVFLPKEYANEKIEFFLVNKTTNQKIAFSEIPLR